MLRYVANNNNNSPNGNEDSNATNNHGYNVNDFLKDSSSSFENEEDNGKADNDDVTLRAPLPNFHMLFQFATETTAMGRTSHHRQEQELLLLKNHDDYLRPFISALLVSCRVLRLSIETTYTAACLLHRYAIAHHSSTTTTTTRFFKNQQTTQLHHEHQNSKHENNNEDDDNDWRWIIASCILLACKVEEEPRRLRDLINMAHMITFHRNTKNDDINTLEEENVTLRYHNTKQQQQQVIHQTTSLSNDQSQDNSATSTTTTITTGGGDALSSSSIVPALLYWESEPPNLDTRYWQAKETLVKTEQHVLRWLAFDVIPSHPHRAVVVMILLSQQQQQQHSTQPDDMTQENGSNKPEIDNIQQQQRPVSSLPADAATGTLMMPSAMDDNDHDTQEQKHHDLVHLAWTLFNNTVFYVEALRHDVMTLATAALEMAQEQQSQLAINESFLHHDSSAPTNGTTTTNDVVDDDDDDTAQQKHISNKETDRVAARPLKKQKSEKMFENDTNIAVVRARQSLQEAMTRVQRLSEISTTN